MIIRLTLLITDIESKLTRIEEDPEGSGTSHLFNCIHGVTSIANRAFESLFERQVSRMFDTILILEFDPCTDVQFRGLDFLLSLYFSYLPFAN